MWAPIKNYEGLYEIDMDGRIKRIGRAKGATIGLLPKTQINTHGYYTVMLSKESEMKRYSLHRLIAVAFIKKPKNKNVINHIDGNPKNNAIENLEWVTTSENLLHSYRITKNHIPNYAMRGKVGDNHPCSKSFLIEYPNRDIIRYESGLDFQRKTGLDHSSISMARRKKVASYVFTQRKMKGLTVHFELVE